MHTLDALGRLLPWSEPDEPRVEVFDFSKADYLMFELMDRHGPLPSNFLIEFQKHLRKPGNHIKNRLTELCRGSRAQGQILVAPEAQFAQRHAHARHKVYELTDNARALLADRGTHCPYPPTGSAWFVHQLMQACVASSIEFIAPSKGFRFVPRAEILTHPKMGEGKGAKNPMALPLSDGKTLIPDDLFALENSESKKRNFIVEIDRATESMEPGRKGDRNFLGKKTTYFNKKLTNYADLFEHNTIRRWWGISTNIIVVTTSVTRAQDILSHLDSLNRPAFTKRVSIAVEPEFGRIWRVPKKVLTHLLDQNRWYGLDGARDITAA